MTTLPIEPCCKATTICLGEHRDCFLLGGVMHSLIWRHWELAIVDSLLWLCNMVVRSSCCVILLNNKPEMKQIYWKGVRAPWGLKFFRAWCMESSLFPSFFTPLGIRISVSPWGDVGISIPLYSLVPVGSHFSRNPTCCIVDPNFCFFEILFFGLYFLQIPFL